jgi:biopolymer transport protein TolR
MAMMISGGRGGRGRRRKPMAEINVTPMVDVMLVLLIVFMITAPMMATGVAVNLPKTRADQLPTDDQQPLVVTVDKDCKNYVGTQKTSVELPQLAPQLKSIADNQLEKRVYVRGDGKADYECIVNVLTLLQRAGFTNAGLPVESKDVKRIDELLKEDPKQGTTP